MPWSRKAEQSCASCTAFYYMGLEGEQHRGKGQCLAHPVAVQKMMGDWCREWDKEKTPEPEIAEDSA